MRVTRHTHTHTHAAKFPRTHSHKACFQGFVLPCSMHKVRASGMPTGLYHRPVGTNHPFHSTTMNTPLAHVWPSKRAWWC